MSDSSVMVLPVPVGICGRQRRRRQRRRKRTIGPQRQPASITDSLEHNAVHRSEPSPLSAAHLEQAVPLGIQRMFELQHVLVLLRVDEFIGKEHRQSLELELHPAICWCEAPEGAEEHLSVCVWQSRLQMCGGDVKLAQLGHSHAALATATATSCPHYMLATSR